MQDKIYQDIQEITRRLRNVENKLTILERRITALEEGALALDERFMDEQSIRDLIQRMIAVISLRPHNHKSKEQGGDAFAALGGNLI